MVSRDPSEELEAHESLRVLRARHEVFDWAVRCRRAFGDMVEEVARGGVVLGANESGELVSAKPGQ